MTLPLPLPPIKDAEGATARELMGIMTRTGPPGEEPPSSTGPSTPTVVPLPIFDGGTVRTLLAQPEDETDYNFARPWFDSTGFTHARLIDDIKEAGAASAELFLEHSDDAGVSFAEPGVSAAPIAVPMANTGQHKSDWIALGTEAIGDRVWRARARGGDGAASPKVKKVHAQFLPKIATRPPRGGTPPGDLPEGDWGTIIFDANTGGALFTALSYATNDDVDLWPDEIAGRHLTPSGPLNRAKYKATGFGGTRPCVEWGGLSPYLGGANPTASEVSWTYYFVIEDLDGGDSAKIWGDVSEPPSFGYQLKVDADDIYGHVNTPGGGNGDNGSTSYDGSGGHIYRWVKSSGASKWYLFIDGVLQINAGANPQASGSATISMMDAGVGLGMSGRVGRAVAYNKAHVAPTAGGSLANGLTGPEVVLKAFWGTP